MVVSGMQPAQGSPSRRQRLIDAAHHVFSQSGYDGATVAAITTRANIATGSFYRYFPSKQACFLDLLDTLYGELMRAVLAGRTLATDGEAKLLASVEAAVSSFMAQGPLARLVASSRHGPEPAVRAKVEAVANEMARLLAKDFDELTHGQRSPTEVRAAGQFLVGGLEKLLDSALTKDPLPSAGALLPVVRRLTVGMVMGLRALNEDAEQPQEGSEGGHKQESHID